MTDKFAVEEAFEFNIKDVDIGTHYCSCYDFQIGLNCIHVYVVKMIKERDIGNLIQVRKRKAGRRENNPSAL